MGSIPTAVWVGQGYFGVDVRKFGSGNSGATNTFRILGKKAGVVVMLVDIFKGWTATSIADILLLSNHISLENIYYYKLFFGVLAVIGHVFPVYEKFKGGKGVATLLGMVLAIHSEAALASACVFIIVLFAFKYVSLGSMVAALAFPLLLLIPRFNPHEPALIVFGFILFLLVVLTHQKNIKRLLAGEESKANIRIIKRRKN